MRGPSRGLEFFELVRRVVLSVLCGALCIGGPKTDTVHRNCFRHVLPYALGTSRGCAQKELCTVFPNQSEVQDVDLQ